MFHAFAPYGAHREMPRKYQNLPRQTIWLDERGRLTVPAYLLEAAGIEKPGWIEIEAYRSLEDCKALFIKRA